MCPDHQVHLAHLSQDSSSFGQGDLQAYQVHLEASFRVPCPSQAAWDHGVLPSLSQVPYLEVRGPLVLQVLVPFDLQAQDPLDRPDQAPSGHPSDLLAQDPWGLQVP